MARRDPHSHADSEQPRPRHLRLRLAVDFASREVSGEAALDLGAPSAGPLDLDTRSLEIREVRTGNGASLPFELGPEEPILGRRLRLLLPAGTREVVVRYRTLPDAPALQWLEPGQTAGGTHPFLFSQCQAIHARSLVPLPDTPRQRLTYEARVEVDEPLGVVMSAGLEGREPGSRPGTTAWRFRMPQPIPPYLLALAAGRLESRDVGPRSRVFAEPPTLAAAAHEFAETEAMIARAEELFGPYDWDRYDMLVLPPAFPYGGMENPRMTFLTPTLLAGDRSLVDVVVHELAHSWTGNLVTNADMEHFWLNEGFTVWAERRLLEALHGEEATVLAWAIGEKALEESLERCAPSSRARTPTTRSPRSRTRRGRASWPSSSARPAAPPSTASCASTSRASASPRSRPRSSSPSSRSGCPASPRGSGRGSGSTRPGCRRTRPCSARRDSRPS
jgi:aminopeptidase N